jgi:hypothetical protein
VVQSRKDQNGVGTFVILNQSQEILSPKSVINQRRDVTWGIQPMFVYQFASQNYYEPIEH